MVRMEAIRMMPMPLEEIGGKVRFIIRTLPSKATRIPAIFWGIYESLSWRTLIMQYKYETQMGRPRVFIFAETEEVRLS